MIPCHLRRVADDVAAASAAYVCNVMPQLAGLPASELFQRLKGHFEAAFDALFHCAEERAFPPDPSSN